MYVYLFSSHTHKEQVVMEMRPSVKNCSKLNDAQYPVDVFHQEVSNIPKYTSGMLNRMCVLFLHEIM